MKTPELEGSPGALVQTVDRIKSAIEVFPPLGIGVGAGFALGCGLGWPIRRAVGPPRAFCGPGVGVGVGLGYGQGFGRRFGKDRRSPQLRGIISNIEGAFDSMFARLMNLIKR